MKSGNSVRVGGLVLAFLLAGEMLGCGHQSARPMTSDVFYDRRRMDEEPVSPVDQPGAVPVERDRPRERAPREHTNDTVHNISPLVKENVAAPAPAPQRTPAATAPATAPAGQGGATTRGASSGKYITLGTIVAEVNGTPIYANKVIASIAPDLAAKAREMGPQEFRAYARIQIQKAIATQVNNELEFAAAERLLEPEEKNLADALTAQWRQQQITAAGGSLELARRNARDQTFEEMIQDRYRLNMSQVFYQKKVVPKIQVGANDLRRYYAINRDKEFTKHDQVSFFLIKIAAKADEREADALRRAKSIRERGAAGQDFVEMAKSENNDQRLKGKAEEGKPESIQKGASVLEDVEKAVWATAVGKVTDVVQDHGALYVAKVVQKDKGEVRPFEDPAVQQEIRDKLESRQFSELREHVQEQLKSQAIVRDDPDALEITVDMAMQQYPIWSGKAASVSTSRNPATRPAK
ncbi:MAG TPA: peptidyl-prolyl cis-trans isomerase [Tepidisphaeraceae bacterium]